MYCFFSSKTTQNTNFPSNVVFIYDVYFLKIAIMYSRYLERLDYYTAASQIIQFTQIIVVSRNNRALSESYLDISLDKSTKYTINIINR